MAGCDVAALDLPGFPLGRSLRAHGSQPTADVGSEDYIRTAHAKGLDQKGVLRHQLRSGLTPVVTMFGLDFGLLLGGSVIIENIFGIPGLGRVAPSGQGLLRLPDHVGHRDRHLRNSRADQSPRGPDLRSAGSARKVGGTIGAQAGSRVAQGDIRLTPRSWVDTSKVHLAAASTC